MEIINVVKQDTVYTFSFTEKELKVLMAAVGGSTPGSVEAVLFKSSFIEKFHTSDYTTEDSNIIYKFWGVGCEALEVEQ